MSACPVLQHREGIASKGCRDPAVPDAAESVEDIALQGAVREGARHSRQGRRGAVRIARQGIWSHKGLSCRGQAPRLPQLCGLLAGW